MAQFRGFSLSDLHEAAEVVGVEFRETGRGGSRGTTFRGRIFPVRDMTFLKTEGHFAYQRRSAGWSNPERRVNAICWHGHREFMAEAFRRQGEGVILTAQESYRGIEDFFRTYVATAYRNIGSQMMPVSMCEACFCADDGNDAESYEFRQLKEEVLNGAYLRKAAV